MLTRIKQISESNLNKILIATGDTKKLETGEQLSNKIPFEEYSDHCIATLFPNTIVLQLTSE